MTDRNEGLPALGTPDEEPVPDGDGDFAGEHDATVVDVEAPDAVGMLYRITRAFNDLDLDIRSARVQTLGATVVDAFYLCDRNGGKLDGPELLAEIERAVLHAIQEGIQLSR